MEQILYVHSFILGTLCVNTTAFVTIPLLQFSMVENLGLMRVFVGAIYIWSLILLKFDLQEGRKGQNYEIYKHLTH